MSDVRLTYDEGYCVGYSEAKEKLHAALAAVEQERDELHNRYADLMSKYQILVKFYDKQEGTPCEQIRHQAELAAAVAAQIGKDAKVADMYAGELTQAECMDCGNQDDVATGASNDTARYIAAAIRAQGAKHE